MLKNKRRKAEDEAKHSEEFEKSDSVRDSRGGECPKYETAITVTGFSAIDFRGSRFRL